MGMPASVRVNAAFPFPALITASGPSTITKVNGVWKIGFTFNGLGQLAAGADPTTKQILIYDQVTGSFMVTTVALLLASAAATRTVIAAGDIVVLANDRIILVKQTVAQAVNVILPAAASRLGVPVTIKDLAGVAAADPLTVTPNGAETIDGRATFPIGNNHACVTFNPIATGGWWVG